MSAIIISAILLVVVVEGSLNGFYTRFTIAEAEYKERSQALADACADTTLSRLAFDATYAGGEVVPVGGDHCQVVGALNPTGNPRTYQIQGVYQNAYTNYLVTIDINSLAVVSWQEVGHL